jgi:hypothetical protein
MHLQTAIQRAKTMIAELRSVDFELQEHEIKQSASNMDDRHYKQIKDELEKKRELLKSRLDQVRAAISGFEIDSINMLCKNNPGHSAKPTTHDQGYGHFINS